MTQATDEKRIIGDVYAVCFSMSIPGNRAAIMKAVSALVDSELEILPYAPDPEWAERKNDILAHSAAAPSFLVFGNRSNSCA